MMTMAEVAGLIQDALPMGLAVEDGRGSVRITVLTVELPLSRESAEATTRLPDGTEAVHALAGLVRMRSLVPGDQSRIIPFPHPQLGERTPSAGEAHLAEHRPAPAADGTVE